MSSDIADPGLSKGWAYFVDEEPYKKHLSGYGDQEPNVSQSNAVEIENINNDHCYFRPAGASTTMLFDLQTTNPLLVKRLLVLAQLTVPVITSNGQALLAICRKASGNVIPDSESSPCLTNHVVRYANMDYLFFISLWYSSLLSLIISYDICCQWSINLWTRMLEFPLAGHIDRLASFITFVVPKFHLPAHVLRCQTAFSLNFSRWVGRTDGEAPERGWADINRAATSTKEMGPGSRRDTLDDYFGDWNWRKVVAMRKWAIH